MDVINLDQGSFNRHETIGFVKARKFLGQLSILFGFQGGVCFIELVMMQWYSKTEFICICKMKVVKILFSQRRAVSAATRPDFSDIEMMHKLAV